MHKNATPVGRMAVVHTDPVEDAMSLTPTSGHRLYAARESWLQLNSN